MNIQTISLLFLLMLQFGCGKELTNFDSSLAIQENQKSQPITSHTSITQGNISEITSVEEFNYEKRNQIPIKKLKNEDESSLESIKEINDGDQLSKVDKESFFKIKHQSGICQAIKSIHGNISIKCTSIGDRIIQRFKMPCIYDEKIYAHGSIIPVSPGRWIYYRGEALALEPGLMLVCKDGELEKVEIKNH
jgi:hypothetical protein